MSLDNSTGGEKLTKTPCETMSSKNESTILSCETPVSATKSRMRNSTSSWNTPKSPEEEIEVLTCPITEVNGVANGEQLFLPDEDPPPYPDSENNPWSHDIFPLVNVSHGDGKFTTKTPELSKLIPKTSTTKNVRMNLAASNKTPQIHRTMPQKLSSNGRQNNEDYLQQRCGHDTFSHKYGTVDMVVFFVIALMLFMLIAKYLVHEAFTKSKVPLS